MLSPRITQKSKPSRRKRLQKTLWIADLCGGELFDACTKHKEEREIRKYFFQKMIKTLNKFDRLDAEIIEKIKQFIKDTPTFHHKAPKSWVVAGGPRYMIEINNEKMGTNKSTWLAVNFLNALSHYISGSKQNYLQVIEEFKKLQDNYQEKFIPRFVGYNVFSGFSHTNEVEKNSRPAGDDLNGSGGAVRDNACSLFFTLPEVKKKSILKSENKKESKGKSICFAEKDSLGNIAKR